LIIDKLEEKTLPKVRATRTGNFGKV